MEIGLRLKEFREKTKIKVPAIALATGITKENLYKWEKGTRPRDVNGYFKLKAYLDRMEMIEDEVQMDREAEKLHLLRLPLITNQPPAFDTDLKAASGTVLLINDEPQLIVERIYAPFLGRIEGAVEVRGDSMYPTIKDGSQIAIHRLNDIKLLDWGSCYFIINRNMKGIVRRVYPCNDGNGIRMVSDNSDRSVFPDIERT